MKNSVINYHIREMRLASQIYQIYATYIDYQPRGPITVFQCKTLHAEIFPHYCLFAMPYRQKEYKMLHYHAMIMN